MTVADVRALARDIVCRPIRAVDDGFLRALYASGRADELAPVPWAAEEKQAFLDQQFTAQHRHYHEHYAGADFRIVERGGQAIGRLYLNRTPGEIRVVDIALTPEFRNQGIGSALLREVLEEGRRSGKRVSIHVEKFNPALRLYERLGFAVAADREVYWLLEWSAEVGGASPAEAS